MIALYRYLAAELLLSQRYLVPVLLCAGLMAVGTTGDNGPLLSTYAWGLVVVLVSSVWLTRVVAEAEEPAQRAVSVVAVGGSDRHLTVTVALALSGSLLLMLVGLGYPVLTGRHLLTWGSVAVGVLAQLCAVFLGVAIGLLTSGRTIPSRGVNAATALAAVLVVIVVDHISPIRPLIRMLSGTATPAQDAGELAVLTAISVAMLAAGVLISRAVAARRD